MKFLFKNITIGKWAIPVPVFLWFALAMIAAIAEISRGHAAINNYDIYTGVFEHSWLQKNLYLPYPAEYQDSNYYGPLFSILIAPFALLPDYLGCFLWCVVNAGVLFFSIQQLDISQKQKHWILLIGVIEMMTSIHNVQFNPMLTGWIILTFVLIEKEKDFLATLFIVAGFLIKIYGIAGIAFFWFSRHKITFIVSFVFWFIFLFCLPMLISSPAFVVQSYKDWINAVVEKNALNINSEDTNVMQDISVMGMIRRIFNNTHLPNYFITVPTAILYALPFLRVSQYKEIGFRISYLCLIMIGVVIFSTSAESSTFVIAVIGFAIWFVYQKDNKNSFHIFLLVFIMLLTSLSATDLIPSYIRDNWIRPYSLKALPCFLVWIVLIFNLLFMNFSGSKKITNG